MSDFRIAKRYAKAAFDSAKEKNLVEAISKDFELIYNTIKNSRELTLLFHNPIINKNKKTEILSEIFKSKVSTESFDFILFLIDKRRDNLILSTFESFFEIRNQNLGIVNVKVTGFNSISNTQTESVKNKLEKLTNKIINIDFKIDKLLLGGLIVQVGDTVYDGSVARRLKLLEEHILK